MKTFKKLLAALFCIALLGPVVTSCSKNDVRDILLTSDKSWEDIVKERPFMANFPKYGGNIQTLVMGPANSTAVTFTDNATQGTFRSPVFLCTGVKFFKLYVTLSQQKKQKNGTVSW